MALTPLIQAREITRSFGPLPILRGVNLDVHPGQAVALIGPNGSGKSTFLKILSRILRLDSGEVLLRGEPIDSLPRKEIARQIAIVPQSARPVFDYGLLEFVLMGYYARSSHFAMPSAAQIDGARTALKTMGLQDLDSQAVSSLSGGELQRALMARALVANAPLWLLDEPTASLDMRHQIALLEVMRTHVDNGGAAIAILHDLAMVHRFFDQVVLLKGGKFLAKGPPEEALHPELVSSVFEVPLQRGIVAGNHVWVASPNNEIATPGSETPGPHLAELDLTAAD